ncbi:MAG: CPBP family intramembrane metalloprotease [Spirochaetales bacterium]|nr:CPBP family intramembrane metalloprotease [Spirochaetales bacterium]
MNHLGPYRPFRFFLIDFLLTWVPLWLAVDGINRGWFDFNLIFMGAAGISAVPAALIMIYTSGSRELVRDFWRRALNPALIPGFWWGVTVLFVPLLMLLSVFISLAFSGSLSQLLPNEGLLSAPLGFVLLHLLYGPLPEELGWRGYGVDSLRSRMNGFWASITFGLIWPFWHLPLFFIEGSYQQALLCQPVPLFFYLAGMIPQAIIMNWIYFHANRSIITAVVFHFLINFVGEAFHINQLTKSIAGALFTIAAVLIVIFDRDTFFRRAYPAGAQLDRMEGGTAGKQ